MTSARPSPPPTLERLRDRIDAVDDMMMELLAVRLAIVREMRVHKTEAGLPSFDPAREAAILARLTARAAELDLDEGVARALAACVVGAGRTIMEPSAPRRRRRSS